jgi:undecaprenyl diphosphate synthase
MSSKPNIPTHVAVIMDGNGRWARQRGMPRYAGHRSGVAAVRATVETAAKRGVRYLTLFAFSSENWSRPAEEVGMLMRLFADALRREVKELHRNNVKLQFIGERERLSPTLIEQIEAAEAETAGNTGLCLFVAVSYGGRWDIARASRRLAERVEAGEIDAASIDEDALESELVLGGIPDVDLLIRTGGERRVSNFLLWNIAYAELWFCDELWPDFNEQRFDDALQFFARRQRRYGHTGEQVGVVNS